MNDGAITQNFHVMLPVFFFLSLTQKFIFSVITTTKIGLELLTGQLENVFKFNKNVKSENKRLFLIPFFVFVITVIFEISIPFTFILNRVELRNIMKTLSFFILATL
jgi:hypothetical protein